MQLMEAIVKRRAIRKFTRKRVPYESIERFTHVASLAPSSMNSQPWEFAVLSDSRRIAA